MKNMKNTQRSITRIHEIATYNMDISANEARRNTHRLRVEVLLRVTLLHSQRFETRAFIFRQPAVDRLALLPLL